MTKPMSVGELRVGGYMLIDGEPCRIMDVTKSKPGKHGSAKARIVAIGVFDGQKRQFVKPVDSNSEVPIIDKRVGQVFAVNPNGVQIMDLETFSTSGFCSFRRSFLASLDCSHISGERTRCSMRYIVRS